MAKRWLFAGVVIAATLITGCSTSKTTTVHPVSSSPGKSSTSAAATSSEASPTELTPVATLDSSQCVEVSGANLDLLTASTRMPLKAADTLEGYNPPSKVRDAIEHFVTTGGAHFDDPDYTKNNKLVKDWVEQVCPT